MGEPAINFNNLPQVEEGDEDPYDDTWYEEEIWNPEPTCEEDPVILREAKKKAPKPKPVKPSLFTNGVFRMPTEDGLTYEKFSFDGRRHLYRPYDTAATRVLLFCARQVEKSTMLGNKALCYMSLIQAYRVLYVSPSATQTKTFSNDRIKEPIETSPTLKRFTTKMLSQNILEKQFINRSKITMRYAFLNADRARGIPAWMLQLDELQDILRDNIPVIEQCTAHAPSNMKRFVYAGTPKSLDNIIEEYRGNQSTQGEWVVPCDGCNNWNILGERNIGKKGTICAKCGKYINPMNERAQWAWQVAWDPIKTPFESYRIPQLMVPWKDWNEILLDYERYPRDKFFNEVLGISYESGLRPLTQAQIRACCKDYRMDERTLDKIRPKSLAQPFFAGIDWGTGDAAYTVLTIATYIDMKFRVIYMKRFVGEESDPEVQAVEIIRLLRKFNVQLIGCDWGFGFGMNSRLIREFGAQRVHKFQYMARINTRLGYDAKMGRWKVHRSEVMAAIFDAIKKQKCEFPRWEDFHKPHANDMLNIYSEYNEKLRMIVYDHRQGNPDDSFHSFLYCWLVSMLMIQRPDILSPSREDEEGNPISSYQGPVDQG